MSTGPTTGPATGPATAGPVTAAELLVAGPQDVSPGWATAVLAANGVDAVVGSVAHQPVGTGQVGDTHRLLLGLASGADPDAPRSLILKSAAADETSRGGAAVTRSYEIEVRAYQHVIPHVTTRVPGCWLSTVDVERNLFSLVLSDVAPAVQGDELAGCGADRAEAAIVELAGLHAPCWERPDLAAHDWLDRRGPDSGRFLALLLESVIDGFVERYGARLAPEHVEVCREVAAAIVAGGRPDEGPRTATHGDFRLDNMLFDDLAPGPWIVDWQTTSWGHASADVSYLVGGSMPAEVRRTEEPRLLRRYHDELVAAGVADYPFAQLLDDVRRDSGAGVLMAIAASMLVGRTERGDTMFCTMATRHAQHLLDLRDLDLGAWERAR